MKNRTAIAIVIMVACFAMSMVFLFISAGFYMISGTKELADRIRDNRWDDLPPKIEFITVDDDSVVVDLPGLDVLVDDEGVDVNVFGIHVDLRDEVVVERAAVEDVAVEHEPPERHPALVVRVDRPPVHEEALHLERRVRPSPPGVVLVLPRAGPRFASAEYPDESDAVNCVVDCFGPTDIEAMADEDYADFRDNPDTIFAKLCGFPLNDETRRVMRLISPLRHVAPGKNLPPFLLLHGTGDPVVNYNQSERLYHRLIDCGYDARMARVPGAPHEGGFWSDALLEYIFDYLAERT